MQRIFRINEHRNTPDSSRRLPENFHPLVGEFSAIHRDAGHVAPRTSEASRKTQCYWVGNRGQDDGNGRGLSFERKRCSCTIQHDRGGVDACYFRRKIVVVCGLTERDPVFDCEVLAVGVAKLAEPGAQLLNQVGESGGREIAKTHHLCSLLRARRERPWRRAAEERDELASFYVEHGLLPGTRCASLPQAQDAPEAPAGPWVRPESF